MEEDIPMPRLGPPLNQGQLKGILVWGGDQCRAVGFEFAIGQDAGGPATHLDSLHVPETFDRLRNGGINALF
jgi:hypothetical protein